MHTFFSSYFYNTKLHNINLMLNMPLIQHNNLPYNVPAAQFHLLVNDFVAESNTINNFNSPQLSKYQQQLFTTNYNSRLPRYTSASNKILKIYPSLDIANKVVEMKKLGQSTDDLGEVILNANLEPIYWLRELKRQKSAAEKEAASVGLLARLQARKKKSIKGKKKKKSR